MRRFFTALLIFALAHMLMPESCPAAGTTTPEAGISSCDHCCPAGGEEDNHSGGCNSSCLQCSCHSPATMESFFFTPVRVVSRLASPEIVGAVPEVFLSKFVPPQNA